MFWDKEADWINYISDGNTVWSQSFNLGKYIGKPVLVMFNVGAIAREYSRLSDDEVVASAMLTLKTMYHEKAE